jgi:hypothetical protein
VVPKPWLMYGRDRDLMVVGNTDLCGVASRVIQGACEHEPRDLHQSLDVAQAILQREIVRAMRCTSVITHKKLSLCIVPQVMC